MLSLKIDVPKNKSFRDHLWCLIGARESYARAIANGVWAGFRCSMRSCAADDFKSKLDESAEAVKEAIAGVERTAARLSLLAALNEHEVMYEGQIVSATCMRSKDHLPLPASWVWV